MSKNIVRAKATKRPRIGLTMRIGEKGDFYLRREYSEAIAALGGIPFHLPLIPAIDFIAAALCELDGILLPGSDSDIDPQRFHAQPHPRLGAVQALRDETDLMVINAADRAGLPILGICYGMQALNVARGGTLVQDIETEIPNALPHQQGEPRAHRSHRITLTADSSLLGHLANAAADRAVNSHHHQAVAVVGDNLRIAARSADQVIEAVEDTRQTHFALGVQWHPELDWSNDEFSHSIFGSFLTAAAAFRIARER